MHSLLSVTTLSSCVGRNSRDIRKTHSAGVCAPISCPNSRTNPLYNTSHLSLPVCTPGMNTCRRTSLGLCVTWCSHDYKICMLYFSYMWGSLRLAPIIPTTFAAHTSIDSRFIRMHSCCKSPTQYQAMEPNSLDDHHSLHIIVPGIT